MDKPAGMTSHDVVQRVRRALGTRAAGHTGTLDPFATGLLVVLVGRATRLARFVEAQPKTYLATARLGIRTTTDDLTGEVIGLESVEPVSEPRVREVLAEFLGTHPQRPPQFSAKRVGGERSYRKARRGEPVELADVSVTVHHLEMLAYRPPEFDFRVTVSAGTYVRAIARDLGERLGVGAHLTRLRREAIGPLRGGGRAAAGSGDPRGADPRSQRARRLPAVELDEPARQAVAHGRAVVDSGEAGSGAGKPSLLLAGVSSLRWRRRMPDGSVPRLCWTGRERETAPRSRVLAAPPRAGRDRNRRVVRRRPPGPSGGPPGDRSPGARGRAGQRAGDLRSSSARGGEPGGGAAAADDRPRATGDFGPVPA